MLGQAELLLVGAGVQNVVAWLSCERPFIVLSEFIGDNP
jgi:hypothetical protein